MNTTIPELSDEQIEAMRFSIMNDVSRASRQKTRRYRKLVLGAAMVVALGGIGTTAVGSFIAGSGGSASYDTGGVSSSSSSDKAVAPEGAAQDSAGTSAGSSDGALTGREIVTTGTIYMTVDKPVAVAQKLAHYVESQGGRIDSRDESAPSGDSGGSVHLVVRIPQTKVTGSIDTFRSYGTVHSVNLADQDVTTQGQDLDARIKALQVSVNRLEGIIAKANSTADVISAETALTKRQADLDSLVAQRRGLTDQVSMSSIEINLDARSSAKNVSPSGFRGGFIDGWNALASTIDNGVHGLGVMLPWIGALLVLGGAWIAGRRALRR